MTDGVPTRILPASTETAAPYWEACKRGELQLQCCDDCGQYQFYPRVICSHCGSDKVSWKSASGKGRIRSFTIVRRGISKAYEAPYVVALVELAEGPTMMTNIVACEPEQVRVGAAVTVDFEAWSEEVTMPVFRLKEA